MKKKKGLLGLPSFKTFVPVSKLKTGKRFKKAFRGASLRKTRTGLLFDFWEVKRRKKITRYKIPKFRIRW